MRHVRPMLNSNQVLLIVGVAATLAGCLPNNGQNPAPLPVAVSLQAEFVVSSAARTAAIAFAPDGRAFYTEKDTGRIRIIANGALLDDALAEVPVNFAGDGGLLGIAVHPNFAQNGRVYVFYTRADLGFLTNEPPAVLDNRIVYFETVGNTAIGSEVFVASFPAGATTANVSGRLLFAPDGKLLVALGDTGDPDSAQDAGKLTGKILRYNDDGTIPAGNLTASSAVFATGIRDVRGLAVDPVSNAVFVLNRGSNGIDTLAKLAAGANFGWPIVNGDADTADERDFVDVTPSYASPLFVKNNHLDLAGLSFNPSTRYGPNIVNEMFFGESATRLVDEAILTGDRGSVESSKLFAGAFPSAITDVAFTPAGTLYVLCETAVLRVAPTR